VSKLTLADLLNPSKIVENIHFFNFPFFIGYLMGSKTAILGMEK
jgi:hypothetical protein